MRKNPAMVAERKIRMTRSGHISSPRKQSMNELDPRKGSGFGFIAGCAASGMGREKKINGGLGEVGLEPGSGWVRRIPLAGRMDFSRDSADGPGTRSPNAASSRNLAVINYD